MISRTNPPVEETTTHQRSLSGRKTAIAAAMAVAVLFGSVGLAAAQTDQDDTSAPNEEEQTDRNDRRQRRSERRAVIGSIVAETIGITVEDLRAEFQDGNSVADVAEANGVAPETVAEALIGALEERLDTAVENGRLTEQEAADRLERRSERIAERIERTPGERRSNADG